MFAAAMTAMTPGTISTHFEAITRSSLIAGRHQPSHVVKSAENSAAQATASTTPLTMVPTESATRS
jgi:hypothetical protein